MIRFILAIVIFGWYVVVGKETALRTKYQLFLDGQFAKNCSCESLESCKDEAWELNERHRKRRQAESDKYCPENASCFAIELNPDAKGERE